LWRIDSLLDEWGVAWADPTAVTITDFTAEPQAGFIQVSWLALSEVNVIGYNLYRSTSIAGDRAALNDELIAVQISGVPGMTRYDFVDDTVQPGETYFYWLESVESGGSRLLDTPAQALAPYCLHLPLVLR
jgi:hypothetical protein